MSQQMHYDEAGQERLQPTADGYDAGYQGAYRDPFAGSSGQKLSSSDLHIPASRDRSANASQRLALAIVSVCMLVPLAGIIFGTSNSDYISLVVGLIGLGLFCLTIMVINFIFNFRH